MNELEVFWGGGSQASWRVLLTLEVKRPAAPNRTTVYL